MELLEFDKLEELDELVDALLALDELTALDELAELDEFDGGELDPPPPQAVSNKEKTMDAIKCTRAN